jgi:hypothetical protein
VRGSFDYSVFGLNVRSDMALPELLPAVPGSAVDVTITLGRLTEPMTQAGLHRDGEALMLSVPDVARYRIEAGSEIVIDPCASAPDRNIRLFLLGSAFGALLHQRGLLPLHANAVEIDGGAVAFMGKSGAGKSTLAAWFHDEGFKIIADDVCVVRFDREGGVHASPGLPRLRLWKETLESTGRSVADYPQSYLGDESWDKYDVAIHDGAASEQVPLRSLYLLGSGDRFAIRQLAAAEAVEAVFANTYRGAFVESVKGAQQHWSASIGLIRQTPVFEVSRVWDLERLADQTRMILEHVREQEQS